MVCLESPISGMSGIQLVVILGYCIHQSMAVMSGIQLVVILGYCSHQSQVAVSGIQVACSGDSGLLHLMHAEHENRGVGQW